MPSVAPVPAPARYPGELERLAVLRDGARVRLRPIRSADESDLVALFERLSPRSVYQRFFTSYRRLPPAWYREFANVDYRSRLALVAEDVTPYGGRLRGVARWEPGDESESVELAVVVEDAWQGRGLGSLLLRHLLAAARSRGIRHFCADVLADNEPMLRVLRNVADIRTSQTSQGVVHLCLVPRVTPTHSRSSVA